MSTQVICDASGVSTKMAVIRGDGTWMTWLRASQSSSYGTTTTSRHSCTPFSLKTQASTICMRHRTRDFASIWRAFNSFRPQAHSTRGGAHANVGLGLRHHLHEGVHIRRCCAPSIDEEVGMLTRHHSAADPRTLEATLVDELARCRATAKTPQPRHRGSARRTARTSW